MAVFFFALKLPYIYPTLFFFSLFVRGLQYFQPTSSCKERKKETESLEGRGDGILSLSKKGAPEGARRDEKKKKNMGFPKKNPPAQRNKTSFFYSRRPPLDSHSSKPHEKSCPPSIFSLAPAPY